MTADTLNIIPIMELVGNTVCCSESFEERIGSHDELDMHSAGRMADTEQPVLEAELRCILDVNRGVEISHESSPDERFSLSKVNGWFSARDPDAQGAGISIAPDSRPTPSDWPDTP